MAGLSPPPKFGAKQVSPMPRSIADWLQLFRWFTALFRTTQQASTSEGLNQMPAPPLAPPPRFDFAALAAGDRQAPNKLADPLTALALLALSRPPYPVHGQTGIIEDTHANRTNYAAATYPNWLYFETDTLVLYLSVSGAWTYVAGYNSVTQANLATYAATLGAADVNTLAWISDFAHMLQWTGSAWQRGPGDPDHSDTFHMFGVAPTDTGWHACDGTANVPYLKYDGTTGTRTLPNTNATPAYAKLGSSYGAALSAPVVPTFAGNALPHHFHGSNFVVDGAGAGWHIQTGNSYGGSFSGDRDWTTSAASSTLSADGTTNENTALTPAGTISLPADPVENFNMLLYYRK